MPYITKGLLKDFYLPDYADGSTVNLLASIIRSRGGKSPHKNLKGLDPRRLREARNVIYLVVDGLGVSQLERFLSMGKGKQFFAKHPWTTISSVFPATTAAAVTTFATGASPAEHAVLSWYLNLHDLGVVTMILPAITRTGSPLAREEFDLHAYLDLPSYIDSVKGRRGLISYEDIPQSRYSRAGTRWTDRMAARTLQGLERQIMAFVRKRGKKMAYAYWPEYDSNCHEHGVTHRKTDRHLRQIDESLARLVRKLQGTDTRLFVLADHGLIDAPAAQRIDLGAVPGFYGCLATITSGDARSVSCFVRPGRVKAFKEIVNRKLGHACVCTPGEMLLAMNAFGPGKPHKALANRAGDFFLMARPGYAFTATLPGWEPRFHVAYHGGMSADEVLVPLYSVQC